MVPRRTLVSLLMELFQKKIEIKTVVDEGSPEKYQGTIDGLMIPPTGEDLVLIVRRPYEDGYCIVEVGIHEVFGPQTWYSISHEPGSEVVDTIEVPLIDGTIPLDEILKKYLKPTMN